ncbi:MAG: hypothetical protein DCF30_12105 [Hyphomicrobiales bacterium]|nr:MAG: hypothetical protein DCF30_12105 [Hyphomicrobiales bacterium]
MSDEDDDAPAVPVAKARRLSVGRKAVVTRLWRAAQRQLDAHEARLDDMPKSAAASETEAKALAVLARTVRELVALDAASPGREDKSSDELSPAAGLRHVAELRKELARRLDVIAAGGSPAGPETLDGNRNA